MSLILLIPVYDRYLAFSFFRDLFFHLGKIGQGLGLGLEKKKLTDTEKLDTLAETGANIN